METSSLTKVNDQDINQIFEERKTFEQIKNEYNLVDFFMSNEKVAFRVSIGAKLVHTPGQKEKARLVLQDLKKISKKKLIMNPEGPPKNSKLPDMASYVHEDRFEDKIIANSDAIDIIDVRGNENTWDNKIGINEGVELILTKVQIDQEATLMFEYQLPKGTSK